MRLKCVQYTTVLTLMNDLRSVGQFADTWVCRGKALLTQFWGLDLSGTLQGAGGVGGLLAVSCNGQFYFPTYDNNGNITKYIDESGSVVAAYEYDDFGRAISQSGPLANLFRHRFSTKYYDPEPGLYYYGRRFYSIDWRIWINRDPIEESGGWNLYGFCCNNSVGKWDRLGLHWEFSTPKRDDQLQELNFTVKYIMSPSERKCCHSVTVDRYVRKMFGVGNRFGPYYRLFCLSVTHT